MNRGAKVRYVEAATQAFWKRSFHEFHDQGLTLLPNVHADLVVGEVNHDPARCVNPPAKVDVF